MVPPKATWALAGHVFFLRRAIEDCRKRLLVGGLNRETCRPKIDLFRTFPPKLRTLVSRCRPRTGVGLGRGLGLGTVPCEARLLRLRTRPFCSDDKGIWFRVIAILYMRRQQLVHGYFASRRGIVAAHSEFGKCGGARDNDVADVQASAT